MPNKKKTATKKTAAPAKKAGSGNLLQQIVKATQNTTPARAQQLVSALVSQVNAGNLKFNKNITQSVQQCIQAIDATISTQLANIMHAPEFQKLEGSWRGLTYLMENTMCSEMLQLRVLNATQQEVQHDMAKALEFDLSETFKKVYEAEYDMPGGEPYGLLVGDYSLTSNTPDIEFLRLISQVAAASFAPFVGGIDPQFLGFNDWSELSKPRDLAAIVDSVEFAGWRGFRESDESAFVALAMPRVLSRVPYGKLTNPVDEFDFEEVPRDAQGKALPVPSKNFTWMNASYVLASKMTESFFNNGWCTEIRGAEGGGKIENLPTFIFKSDKGDMHMQCPTEVAITDRREFELDRLGFIPFCHYKKTDYAVIFGGQTAQKPLQYDNPDASANADVCARLPYVMVASRIAHHLKVMGRDKIGSLMEIDDVKNWLNSWIIGYVNGNKNSGTILRYQKPLAKAKIEVEPIAGKPGAYNAIAWIQPWLAMEELKCSVRLVAELPGGGGKKKGGKKK